MNRLIYRALSSRPGARLELQILLCRTAKVFGVDAPKVAGCSASELLKIYAQFTTAEATRVIQNGENLEALHQKMYQMAYTLGSILHQWLRPKNDKDCLAVIILLYRNIGIQIDEKVSGTFCVRKCYFSDFYTPEICAVISAIDQGIFAGVYQHGRLTFRERITEGQDVCRADFKEIIRHTSRKKQAI